MSKVLYVLAGLIGGYVAGALIGAGLLSFLSTNTHDRSVEMAMTAAFVTGPIGAVLGVIGALWRSRMSRGTPSS